MRSSISNSSSRAPIGRWWSVWLIATVLSLSFLCAWEGFWRSRGLRPTLRDDQSLWCFNLRTVRPKSVVLLGASRILADIDLPVLSKALGRTVIQLGVAGGGTQVATILEHFADDETFCGMVVVSVIPRVFFRPVAARSRVDDMISFCDSQLAKPAQRSEYCMRLVVQASLVSRQPAISMERLYSRMITREWPAPTGRTVDRNRHVRLDGQFINKERRIRGISANIQEATEPTNDQKQLILERFERSVKKIQSRGGRVVAVHLPTSGAIEELEERRFPRLQYWDVFANYTGAMTINADDFEAFDAIECPDGSHMDFRDQEDFTRQLAKIILERINHLID